MQKKSYIYVLPVSAVYLSLEIKLILIPSHEMLFLLTDPWHPGWRKSLLIAGPHEKVDIAMPTFCS